MNVAERLTGLVSQEWNSNREIQALMREQL